MVTPHRLPRRAGLLIALLWAAPALAATIRVPAEQPTIQAAIDVAAPGDTVLIAPGTYTGAGNKNLDFGGRDLVVTSEAGAASTVIDCQGSGRGFLFIHVESPAAVVSGLTIRHGDASSLPLIGGGAVACAGASPTIRDCVLEQNAGAGGLNNGGGALFALNSAVTIADCVIRDNALASATGVGGGMSFFASTPTIQSCEFVDNATQTGNNSAGGGLIAWQGSEVNLSDCTFTGNVSIEGGGMIVGGLSELVATDCTFTGNSAYTGGGIAAAAIPVTLTRCTFRNNNAWFGGGAEIDGDLPVKLDHCVFAGNQAGQQGGGVRLTNSLAVMTGCTFAGNTAPQGGGVVALSSQIAVSGCTFQGNDSPAGGGLLVRSLFSGPSHAAVSHTIFGFNTGTGLACFAGSSATLACSDVFGNSDGDWVGCIAGQLGQDGNIGADPLFCDAEGGDLRIAEGSPCAPFTPPNPQCALIGAWPVGCGATAVQQRSWGQIKAAYR